MNKVILSGRFTKDPELRYTSSENKPVCNGTIAVPKRFVKPEDEVKADYVPLVFWGKGGETVAKYFKKGSKITLVGRLQTRKYQQDGKNRYITEVVVEEFEFGEKKVNTDAPNENSESGSGSDTGNESLGQESGDSFYPLDDSDELPF